MFHLLALNYIRLVTHNYQAQSINESKLAELPGTSRHYKASITGDFPEQSFPTELCWKLKEDAQVMFVKNDSTGKGRYYNGMLGKVVSTTAHGVTVKATKQGADRPIARRMDERQVRIK